MPETVIHNNEKRDLSLTSRAAWLLIAKVIAFAFTFMLPLFLVRRLSQEEFGLYKQVFLVVGTAVTMLPLGFGMSAFYFLPRERTRRPQIVLNIVCFYFAVALLVGVLVVVKPMLLAAIFNSTALVRYAVPIGIIILLWVVGSFLDIVAVAHQESRVASLFIVTSQASKTLLLLGAAVWFGTLKSLVYAAMLQGAVQSAMLFVYLRSRFGAFWRRFHMPTLKAQLSYALPLGFAGLLFSIQMDVHQYFVSYRFGPSIYAIYAVGCFQLPLVAMLSESVCSVMIPRVSLLQKNDQNHEIILLTARVMRKLAFIYFPLYAFLMVAGREFITVLFTSQYASSWPVFAVNITMVPIGVLSLDPILRAYAEQRFFILKLRVALVAGLLFTLWIGTNRLGPVGTITVVVSVAIIERMVTAIRMGRIVGVSRRDAWLLADVVRLAVASIAAAMLTLVLKKSISNLPTLLVLFFCGVSFVVFFATAVVLLGIIKREEKRVFRRWIETIRQFMGRRDVTQSARGGMFNEAVGREDA